jgi:predicted dehydrogenase
MPRRLSRRQVIKTAAVASVGFWVAGRGAWADEIGIAHDRVIPPSERLNVGFVGTANRAANDLADTAAVNNVNVIALCDINDTYLGEAAKKYPGAETYNDFRHMLDGEKDLDAVVVATPDHTHAIAAISAMKAGKHVYCEKPLARTVGEVRAMTETAAGLKRVTQMGTQIHASSNYRRVVELIRSGIIGPVRETHVICEKTWAATQPVVGTSPVPKDLHFDLWLGPTPTRPYNPAYLPATWRRYWMFGSGTLGDMGCHYLDLPFWALDLKYPTHVTAEGPPPHAQNCPTWLAAHWDFPARGDAPPTKLSWYDGGKRPAAFEDWEVSPALKNGVLFVGDKGALFSDYDQHKLYPHDDFIGFARPKPTIAPSVGHHREWVLACLKNDPSATTCRFGYSGPLAETVLLGTVAYRLGKPLDWDAANLKATNAPEAEALIHQPYREGWIL